MSDMPIRQRLMRIVLMTSGAVLLLTCSAFFAYEFISSRQSTVNTLNMVGAIVADNSTAALAFDNPDDAGEVLGALRANKHITAAALYDKDGRLFAKYPRGASADRFPSAIEGDGFRFHGGTLIGFQPVIQGEGRRLGTLYLQSDMGAMYERFRLYLLIVLLVILFGAGVAYLISRRLQQQISQPLLSLAATARTISDRRDYSVRAAPALGRELNVLTEAFNHMLTQIQEREWALKESEARVRSVLNSALSAVIVMDAHGRILDWNTHAETLFGWFRAEAVGRDLADTIIPTRLRPMHRAGLDRYLAGGPAPILNKLMEMMALRRDGSEFPVELSVSAIRSGGTVTFCGFLTDITERKEAQQKIQAQLSRHELLNRITRAIGERQDLASTLQIVARSVEDNLPVDFACVCLYEQGAKELTVVGIGVKSELASRDMALTEQGRIPIDENGLSKCVLGHLVYEPDVREVKFAFPQRLMQGGLRSVVFAPLITESRVFGVLIAARIQDHSFSSADCEFLRQLGEHVALATHQMQLYTALQQAYDDLRQSQQTVMQQERLRALGQMASGIAHDINNAISPAALYTESLLERETNLTDRAREYLKIIQRAIEDVAETVARMREFYRMREPQLQLAPVKVNQLIEQVLNLTRARWSDEAQQRGAVIKTRLDLQKDLPDIMGAETEIRDALTNLVFNGVDAMPEGGTLTIRTYTEVRTSPDGETPAIFVRVEVTDTGIGMDEETRRRCLEPFFTTKGERGTGLGLPMVYGMVQRHSADLQIDSEAGKGTTMRLIFAQATPSFEGAVRLAAPQTASQQLSILIVDDDPLLIKSLRDILEADGHLVTPADGGQAGIDTFIKAQKSGKPFAFVITDLGMPYVDGRKVSAAIRAASPSVPIVMLTGWGQRLVAENDIPPHVNRVLNKPPKLQELRTALVELTAARPDAHR